MAGSYEAAVRRVSEELLALNEETPFFPEGVTCSILATHPDRAVLLGSNGSLVEVAFKVSPKGIVVTERRALESSLPTIAEQQQSDARSFLRAVSEGGAKPADHLRRLMSRVTQ